MTEGLTQERILKIIHEEIAAQRVIAANEPDPIERDRMLRHARTREDVAEDEAEAIAAEIAENRKSQLASKADAPGMGSRIRQRFSGAGAEPESSRPQTVRAVELPRQE